MQIFAALKAITFLIILLQRFKLRIPSPKKFISKNSRLKNQSMFNLKLTNFWSRLKKIKKKNSKKIEKFNYNNHYYCHKFYI